MIDRVYLVRHGDYSSGPEELTSSGKEEIKKAAKSIVKSLDPKSVPNEAVIFSSTAKRARESAIIIAETLGLDAKDIVYKEYLFSNSEEGAEEKAKKIRNDFDYMDNRYKVAIVVTHKELTKAIPKIISGVSHEQLKTGELRIVEYAKKDIVDSRSELQRLIKEYRSTYTALSIMKQGCIMGLERGDLQEFVEGSKDLFSDIKEDFDKIARRIEEIVKNNPDLKEEVSEIIKYIRPEGNKHMSSGIGIMLSGETKKINEYLRRKDDAEEKKFLDIVEKYMYGR